MESAQPTTEARQGDRESSAEGVTISRSAVYIFVTAIAFFIIGYSLAWVSFSAISNAQAEAIEEAVYTAVAEAMGGQGGSAVADSAPPAVVNASVDDDPARGPEDAPIVMVEFSDFRCPYCGRFNAQTLDPLFEIYADQLRLVYRDFPVVGGALAAEAAECADDQGAFWAYHDAIFANQQDLSEAGLIGYAEDLGLDMDTFAPCLQDHVHSEEIQNDFNDGRSYGVTGTPTFFVNGRRIVGAQPLAVFQEVIDAILAEQTEG